MTRDSSPRQPPGGFTLIEVMAVVALIGLLAGATAWSLADDARRAHQADVADRLAHADAIARAAARRLGPSTLHIDLDRQRVWVVSPGPKAGRGEAGHAIAISNGFRIEQVVWVDPVPDALKKARKRPQTVASAGIAKVPISSEGFSRTYAIQLSGPKAADERASSRTLEKEYNWLLFSGMTGQVTNGLDEAELQTIFDTLSQTRPDAD